MKVYFASYKTTPDVVEMKGDFGVLTSYVDCGNQPIPKLKKPLFLDSGAFSVMTQGIEIDIDDYASYIKENIDSLELYANLDVIGDAQATQENQDYLEALGLNPLPTFHYGSNYENLKRLAASYTYIGLGGLVPIAKSRKKLQVHLDRCFKIIREVNPKLKVHGWGMTSYFAVMRYPFYSVDSTSWLVGGRFKTKISYTDTALKPKKSPLHSAYNYHNLNIENAREIVKMVENATRLWKHRGVVYD